LSISDGIELTQCSINTKVELTVSPRSATPDEPAAKPAPKAVGMVPLLSAEMLRTTSEMVVSPAF
jgi:hypothetical protein